MTDKEGIPAYLVERVQQGDVVLVLGAGASFGAKNSDGKSPPSGWGLGELMRTKFLGA